MSISRASVMRMKQQPELTLFLVHCTIILYTVAMLLLNAAAHKPMPRDDNERQPHCALHIIAPLRDGSLSPSLFPQGTEEAPPPVGLLSCVTPKR